MILKSNKLKILIFLIVLNLFSSCGIYKKVDKNIPISGEERARKNVAEGRGVSLAGIGKNSTTYEFSTSNPMWRATLEILDFLPLSTVDYSGGVIITDWYSANISENSYLKITVRFLSTEINASNIKIIVHQKNCNGLNSCNIKEINSNIKEELLVKILKSAKIIETSKNSKKK